MTVSAPLVSVVIPVYNSMPYLTDTLQSVLAQDVERFEVIAVDDGSSDGSGDELDRFAALDERLTVIHQANSGWPGAPRNRGLERARGEFVFFMDSDDTLAPSALREMSAMAQERGADVVIPRMRGVAGRDVQSLFQRHPQGEIGLSRAMETLSPQKLFRRASLDRHGLRFPEENVRLEDGIFVTRAYVHARSIAFCGERALYSIALRDDGQNISARPIDPDNYVASCRTIAQTLLDGVADPALAPRLVREFFSRKGLRFYAPKRWDRMSMPRKQQWVSLHAAFLADLLPASEDDRISNPTDRRKVRLIRAGDVRSLDSLIAAEARLAHRPGTTQLRALPDGIELTVRLTPSMSASLGRSAPLRLAIADRLHRSLRPYLGHRIVRGASRRLGRLLTAGCPHAVLLLSGRRSARTLAIPGRAATADPGTGDPRVRFVLPESALRRFTGDRVDAWTVALAGSGLSGGRERVTADAPLSKRIGTARAYATDRGNLSFEVTRSRAAGGAAAAS